MLAVQSWCGSAAVLGIQAPDLWLCYPYHVASISESKKAAVAQAITFTFQPLKGNLRGEHILFFLRVWLGNAHITFSHTP